jgi:uncharacterized membrane protein
MSKFREAAEAYEEKRRNRDKREAELGDTFFDWHNERPSTMFGIAAFILVFIGIALTIWMN